ncbi:Bug family tripartite tricarboxylate transporter substrate binding protein [Cupriavidus sp. CuC1]|uniref:Bug family tripartite tricarboxylate transporter substrate binding protein n=1 Tax=Cupriavidus sp. CuC1 TaxID=3373131 RepID=UPI0037D325A9
MIESTRRQLMAAMALTGLAWSVTGFTQRFPEKLITIVVAYPPGSDTDVMARLYGEKLASRLRQPVLVVNRAGASGMVGSSYVAHAAADGYTLLFAPSTFATAPLVLKRADSVGYNPVTDFASVIQTSTSSMLLVANPSAGFKNLADVLQASKQGKALTYGTSGSGSPMHILGEWLNRATGAKLQHVPYKGVVPSVTDVVAGHIPVAFVTVGVAREYLRAGKLAAIAVADPGRSPFLPDVPTIAESGYPEVRLRAWNASFAPAGTPAPVVRLLNEQLAEVLRLPDVIEKLAGLSAVPAGGLPESLGTQVASDYDQLGQRIRELRIQAD